MPQREIEANGVKRLEISVNVSCPEHPSGRIQIKRRFDGVVIGSTKANNLERDLMREAERERAERMGSGKTWGVLLELYETQTNTLVEDGDFVQSRSTFKEAISALHRWTRDWSDIVAAQITPQDVTRLFHKMKAEGCADSTIQKVRGDIKKVFDFGLLQTLIRGVHQSPTVGVTIKSRRRMRTEILSEDEIIRLLKYAKQYEPVWFYIWAFAVYTGCRNGELYALKWTDIDFGQRIITIQRSFNKKFREEKSTKTGEWRNVWICDPLWELVVDLKEKHDHDVKAGVCRHPGYVLPRPGTWQNGDQAAKLRQFCAEIGITPVCFHSLRACFATELLKRGVDVPSVMRVGGWASMKTMMHYVRLSGVDDVGITKSLDYRKKDPLETSKVLMGAVGERYDFEKDRDATKVIPLAGRSLLYGRGK